MEIDYVNINTGMGTEGRLDMVPGTIYYNQRYYVMDYLGSTRIVCDGAGIPVENVAYYAYGEQIPLGGAGTENAREKFTGKEFDQEGTNNGASGMNLDYFGARYYDPVIGVWGSTDPAEQDWNVYGYCANNPTNFVDPDGEEWIVIALAAILYHVYHSLENVKRGMTYEDAWNPFYSGWYEGFFEDATKNGPIGAGVTTDGTKSGTSYYVEANGTRVNPMQEEAVNQAVAEFIASFNAKAYNIRPVAPVDLSASVNSSSSGNTSLQFPGLGFQEGQPLKITEGQQNEWVIDGIPLVKLNNTANSVKGAAAASLYLIGQATGTLDNSYMQSGIQTFSALYDVLDVASMGMMAASTIRMKPGSLGQFKGTDALRAENAVARDAAKSAGLNKDQQKILHREISGQGLNFKDILQRAQQIKGGGW